MPHPNGLHHVTAVAGNPQQNLDFYTGLLGLRLVKKTVNYDDPSSYHLFYGDAAGNPGSILSFLTSPRMQQGEPDVGQVVALSLSIPVTSVDFWVEYLSGQGLDFMEPFERFGKLVIGLQDPDGLYVELIGDPEIHYNKDRDNVAVPAEHAIRGLHGITLSEENYRATGQLLTESLEFEEINEQHDRILYQANASIGSTIEVIDGAELNGAPGKGTVHHLAFRVESDEKQQQMRQNLKEIGYHVTEIEDRNYFKSFFFHEPGGALIEIATNQPGFTIDEEPDALGSNLCLPPKLEEKRSLIEAELPEIG